MQGKKKQKKTKKTNFKKLEQTKEYKTKNTQTYSHHKRKMFITTIAQMKKREKQTQYNTNTNCLKTEQNFTQKIKMLQKKKYTNVYFMRLFMCTNALLQKNEKGCRFLYILGQQIGKNKKEKQKWLKGAKKGKKGKKWRKNRTKQNRTNAYRQKCVFLIWQVVQSFS